MNVSGKVDRGSNGLTIANSSLSVIKSSSPLWYRFMFAVATEYIGVDMGMATRHDGIAGAHQIADTRPISAPMLTRGL